MSKTTQCPRPIRLQDLLDGNLPATEQKQLQAHLEVCPYCQQALETVVAGRESWEGAARKLAQQDPKDEALRRVMNRLQGKQAASLLSFLSPSENPEHLGRLGPYEIHEVIGQGGMGIVLKAFEPSLHRLVAIKVLAPHMGSNGTARRRFLREAQAAAAVVHEHVVPIHSIETTANPPYIGMQYIAGCSLQDKLDRNGPLELQEILRIGMQTASGLAAAHAQGLVHRDIKPANILLENGVERVKLTDFGLARAADDASMTQSGFIAGTPQYMAPEQASGEFVDHRADLFSLGSVLYAMCTGRPPFRASTTLGVIKRVCEEAPRPIREINPDIPEWLEEIIAKLHRKNPDERFQSAAEVAELLGSHLAHLQSPRRAPKPARVRALASAPHLQNSKSHFVASQLRRVVRAFLFFALLGAAVSAGFLWLVVFVSMERSHAPKPRPASFFVPSGPSSLHFHTEDLMCLLEIVHPDGRVEERLLKPEEPGFLQFLPPGQYRVKACADEECFYDELIHIIPGQEHSILFNKQMLLQPNDHAR